MVLKRYVFDTNVLVSAILLPDSTAFTAYVKALETGVLLAIRRQCHWRVASDSCRTTSMLKSQIAK